MNNRTALEVRDDIERWRKYAGQDVDKVLEDLIRDANRQHVHVPLDQQSDVYSKVIQYSSGPGVLFTINVSYILNVVEQEYD